MKLITAIIEPDVTDDLVPAVTAAGASGMTATEVVSLGQGPGQAGVTSSGACAALQPRIRGSTLSCTTTWLTPWSAPSQNARMPEQLVTAQSG
jgi:hypothetical protein